MIRITEVGPRDGLQNEATSIDTDTKLRFIQALAEAGLRSIEATSFVSPKWVPQLADAAEIWPRLPQGPAQYSALVPNLKGLERAISVGVREIALFTAASDDFTQRNINMTVDESLAVFAECVAAFRTQVPEGRVRVYVSTAFECPFAGRISPSQVARVATKLSELSIDEISIGDTIGVAVPSEVRALAPAIRDAGWSPEGTYWHFHDTRGTAVANVSAALDLSTAYGFDSAAGGLGGCPYAPGAGGNLATDDLVYFLARSGLATGVDPTALARASLPILNQLGRAPHSRAQRAVLASDA